MDMADKPSTTKSTEKKPLLKRAVHRVKTDNERGARQGIIEDLFVDFNRSRTQVYVMNFIRGIFFGFGSVLGATILISLLVWLLGQFVNWPGVGDFFQQLTDALKSRPR